VTGLAGSAGPLAGGAGNGGPLTGVKVVDLTINVLGPVATQMLGDMGAEVIKVETPQGDPMRESGPGRHPRMSVFYMNMNRNKKSVVLDLKVPAALDALLRLAESADVIVHSMRPQAAERLGIGAAAIAARNPRAIYAFAPGYRSDGPNRDRPAFDDVIQGESGVAGLMHRATGEARYFPSVMSDKLCGVYLASAISMALYERERSGRGQVVEVPMLETMLSFNLVEHLWTGAFGPDEGRLGYVRALSPHRRPYATRDGFICLLAVNDEQWKRLFVALDRPELAADERFANITGRTRHIDDLYAIVAAQVAKRASAEWRERLDAADIPNGSMNELDDLPGDAYLAETGFFRSYQHPSEGPLITTAISQKFSRTPGAMRLAPPRLGQHNREVLQSLGYSESEITAIGAGAVSTDVVSKRLTGQDCAE